MASILVILHSPYVEWLGLTGAGSVFTRDAEREAEAVELDEADVAAVVSAEIEHLDYSSVVLTNQIMHGGEK